MLYVDFPVPMAPEGREEYEYKITGADTYSLCATFAEATPTSERSVTKPISANGDAYLQNQNWEHGVGRKCFERKIIPIK